MIKIGLIRDSTEKIPLMIFFTKPGKIVCFLSCRISKGTCWWSWGVVSGDKALLLILLVVVVLNVLVHIHLDLDISS